MFDKKVGDRYHDERMDFYSKLTLYNYISDVLNFINTKQVQEFEDNVLSEVTYMDDADEHLDILEALLDPRDLTHRQPCNVFNKRDLFPVRRAYKHKGNVG